VPKVLLEVGRETILARHLRLLSRHPDMRRIIVVGGYQFDLVNLAVRSKSNAVAIHNQDWQTSNNGVSLLKALTHLDRELAHTVVVDGDNLYEESIYDIILNSQGNCLLYNTNNKCGDVITVRQQHVVKLVPEREADNMLTSRTIGLYQYKTDDLLKVIGPAISNADPSLCHEDSLNSYKKIEIKAKSVGTKRWAEVDTQLDLLYARSQFN